MSNMAEAHLYGEEVGPITFTKEDKYETPQPVASKSELFPKKAVERVFQEVQRPNVLIPYRPKPSYIIEEVL